MQVVVVLKNSQGEKFTLFLKGSRMMKAVKRACEDAGTNDIEIGGELKITYTGVEGVNSAKCYEAAYRPPTDTFKPAASNGASQLSEQEKAEILAEQREWEKALSEPPF
jgi:hypothetical protein